MRGVKQLEPAHLPQAGALGKPVDERLGTMGEATSAQLGSSSAGTLTIPLLKLQVMRTSVPLVGAILRRCAAALRNGAGGRETR